MAAREQGTPERVAIDWGEVARAALSSAFVAGLVGGALHVLGKVIEAEAAEDVRDAAPEVGPQEAEENPDSTDDVPIERFVDRDVLSAALLLGVGPDASADEIRAALRARLADSRLHPDQGGDGEEAKELIAAKNLLIERARANAA
jgi:hypothetical protein